jgi:hypothetical protein
MYVRGLVAGAGGLSFKQSRDGKWHSSEGTDSAAESDECDAMASTSTGKTRARMVVKLKFVAFQQKTEFFKKPRKATNLLESHRGQGTAADGRGAECCSS